MWELLLRNAVTEENFLFSQGDGRGRPEDRLELQPPKAQLRANIPGFAPRKERTILRGAGQNYWP